MAILASSCIAESLQITSTLQVTTAKRGQAVPVAVSLKNILTPREPITLTAEAEWEDEYGVARTTTTSATITVVQPVKINRYKVAIPALFDFVAGSAKVNGQPATPTLDSGRLVFEIAQTLLEGESVALQYSVKAQ
jgi:hypothetical protein